MRKMRRWTRWRPDGEVSWRRNYGQKNGISGPFCGGGHASGICESLIPVFVTVPGMKLGLANLAVVLALYLYGGREAAAVSAVRIVLNAFLFGSLFSLAFQRRAAS